MVDWHRFDFLRRDVSVSVFSFSSILSCEHLDLALGYQLTHADMLLCTLCNPSMPLRHLSLRTLAPAQKISMSPTQHRNLKNECLK
jgi:hypothetical protein